MTATSLRIIGIDPGLRRTGWGVIEWDGAKLGYVASGAVTSDAAQPLALRLSALFAGLEAALAAFSPIEAAIEQTFVNRDAHATLKLGQARGIALLAPARAGLLVAEYAPNLVKKTVTGSGHAEKQQIRAMIGFLLPKAAPGNADEADALAIAITHAHHRRAAQLLAAALGAQHAKPPRRAVNVALFFEKKGRDGGGALSHGALGLSKRPPHPDPLRKGGGNIKLRYGRGAG